MNLYRFCGENHRTAIVVLNRVLHLPMMYRYLRNCCRFVVTDTTLAVEKSNRGSGFLHEHPDSFNAGVDTVLATAPALHEHLLHAFDTDMHHMKTNSGLGWTIPTIASTLPLVDASASSCSAAALPLLKSRSGTDVSLSGILSDILGCFVLRRTKDSIDLQLPTKTRVECWVHATPVQQSILATLKHATLLLLGANSVLGRGVIHASASPESGVATGSSPKVELSTAAEKAVDHSVTTDHASTSSGDSHECFVGELGGVFPKSVDTAQCLADIGAGRVGNASGRLIMLLRKAALHPLLLRSYYSNERVLDIAALLFGSSSLSEGKFASPPFSDINHRISSVGENSGVDASGTLSDAALLELHRDISRGDTMRWAEAHLCAALSQKPSAKQVKALSDLAESLLHSSVSAMLMNSL